MPCVPFRSPSTPPGSGFGGRIVNGSALLVWFATVTVTGPVTAASGAFATMLVSDASEGTAFAPANCTRFCDAVGLKPAPLITTGVPAGPACGTSDAMLAGGGPWIVNTDTPPLANVWPS